MNSLLLINITYKYYNIPLTDTVRLLSCTTYHHALSYPDGYWLCNIQSMFE